MSFALRKVSCVFVLASGVATTVAAQVSELDAAALDELSERVLYLDGAPAAAVNLTPLELQIIESKRDAIIQYLYQEQELRGARSLLQESQRQDAVDASIREQMPLTPDEIIMIRQELREAARAENAPLVPPRLEMRTVDLDVEGNTPLEIRVARGYSSSIVFFDETGSPWPLQSGVDALGDASAFSAQTVSEQGHVATFQILKEFSQSNALVILEGLPVPVVLRLVGETDVVDSRLSVRVPRHGPNAKVTMTYRAELDNAPPEMMMFLNGETVPGSTPYRLDGVPGEVVRVGQRLYLRTRANLITPPPYRSVVSASGYNVYMLPAVTHLLFSANGERREALVEPMRLPGVGDPQEHFYGSDYQ